MDRKHYALAIVWVLGLGRIKGDCGVSTITSLQHSADDVALSSCFDIEDESELGKKLCPGDVLKIDPRDVYISSYPSREFNCTSAGWSSSPASCTGAVKTAAAGSCITDDLVDKGTSSNSINRYDTNLTGYDKAVTRVLEDTVIQYWAKQPDCFEFNITDRDNNETVDSEGKLVTTCKNGTFVPPVAKFYQKCCDYPMFRDTKDVAGDLCIDVKVHPVSLANSDGSIIKSYIKNGTLVKFDKKCPCFTFDLIDSMNNTVLNTTCIHGQYYPTIPRTLENRCCKVPYVPEQEGNPMNNVSDVTYVTWGSYVHFTCHSSCYKINNLLEHQVCNSTTDLEVPTCIRDPSCCVEENVTSSYYTDYNVTEWPYLRSGKRHIYNTTYGNASRRCSYSEWDIIKYYDVQVDEETLSMGLEDIEAQNCSELYRLAGVNLTLPQYKRVVGQWINYTKNMTSNQKLPCYYTMRYFLSDPNKRGFLKVLDTWTKNEFIGAIKRTMKQWVSKVSETIYRKTNYLVARVKMEAKHGTGTKALFNFWQVELKAGDYVKQLLLVFLKNAILFPNTTHSSIVSPVVFVDLPLNMTPQPKYTNPWNKITVNFTSFTALKSRRHYSCGVYDPDDGKWKRDACENVTVSGQSVVCNCHNWTRFIAVTQTFNHSPSYLGSFMVGDANTNVQIKTTNALNIVAMVPLIITFFLLISATTKRKALHQCRLQVIFCMVSTNLVALLTYFLQPANISCVYMMYIFEIFGLSTLLWFIADLNCVRRLMRAKDDSFIQVSKMYPAKCCFPVYLTALIVPTVCLLCEKLITNNGIFSFVEPFDAQNCWFNRDIEFLEFFVPMFACMFGGILMLLICIVTFFIGAKTVKSDGLDLLASGLMFFLVVTAWIFQLFRGNDYFKITGQILAASQGLGSLILYIGLSDDIKMSLFPGCYPDDDDKDDQKH